MLYYKVKHDGDQFVIDKNFNILVKGELFTQKEYEKIRYNFLKMGKGDAILKSKFELIEIPKNKTYFFFGARFAMEGQKMTVKELNRDQIDALKWNYFYSDEYDEKNNKRRRAAGIVCGGYPGQYNFCRVCWN